MAISKVTVSNNTWTAIGNNVTSITFQNIGQFPVFINFTANTTPPVISTGLVYDLYQGEVKQLIADLTFTATPTYVWARAVGASGSLVVET